MKKAYISLLITVTLVFGRGFSVLASDLKWDDYNKNKQGGVEWPIRPPDGYKNEQNPPDFSWTRIEKSTYDLIICTDRELKNIKYEKRDLTDNFFNFSYPFDIGTYYWSVRFKNADGVSEWMEARRFQIMPDAEEYTIDIGNVVSKIPKSHPRVCVSKDELPEFRKLKDNYPEVKHYYESLKKTVKGFMETPIPEEPVFDPSNSTGLRGTTQAVQNRMAKAGELYLIDNDEKVGRYCAKVMLSVAAWDINGATAYENQDQAFREIVIGMAKGYDWVYDILTPAERTIICNCLEERMKILEHPTKGLLDAAYRVPEVAYASHGWTAMGFLITAAMATLGDIPFAETILEKYVPIYANLSPVWGREDGGYAQGTGYASGSVLGDMVVDYNLDKYGIATLSNKAYFRNEYKFPLYFLGGNYGAPFGDQSVGSYDSDWETTNQFLIFVLNNGYLEWQSKKYGFGALGVFQNYYLRTKPRPEAKAPVDLPNSVALVDVGHVAMHSDLTDPYGRISLYFKSSPFGSYNHSHADQNSFTVVAYNEELAADTGYYDGYNYDFWTDYYTRTHAHNTLTFDNGEGEQPNGALFANGEITNFITHPDFDLVTGAAATAYNYREANIASAENRLERFDRSIIYVRPDKFVIIDDVKKGDGKKSTFEFWLNAKNDISLYNTGDGAKIESGNAVLENKIHYPEVKAHYSNLFSGTDLVAHTPKGNYTKSKVHERIWFKTPETEETKIVSTMSVHKKDEPGQYVYTEKKDNYMLLTFEDGTRVYVNLTSDEIKMGEYKTDATAIVIKKETLMAVNATKVEKDNELLFQSDKKASYVYGKNELYISSKEDTKVKIKTADITSVKNEKNYVVEPKKNQWGYSWDYEEGFFTADLCSGFYSMYLNGKPLPGTPAKGESFKYYIDGREYTANPVGYYDHDNNKVISASIENNTDFYFLDKVGDINIRANSKQGELLLLRKGENVFVTGNTPELRLRSFADNKIVRVEPKDKNEMKEKCDVFVEAENFVTNNSGGNRYNTRKFMSGGAGVSEFNTFGDSITWEAEIPEDGEYDLVFCYVGWSGENGSIQRMFNINGNVGSVNLPETGNYGQVETEWVAAEAETALSLKKGKTEITLYPKIGNWNLDWIGLVKR